MCDVLIRNGRILDGTGAPPFRADVATTGDRIVAIGDLTGRRAKQEIDASEKYVCPGFVEEHSHSDTTLLVDPLAQSAMRQGITTMAVGMCGMSVAPVVPHVQEEYRRTTSLLDCDGVDWPWRYFGDYLDALRQVGPSVNVLSMAGHVPLRMSVMKDPNRPATDPEIEAMRRLLDEALQQGARGFSTGLNYKSSVFATTEEVIGIAEALVPYGLAYHTHIRDYGARITDAIVEAIRIAETAGVPLVISHMYPNGRDNWGKSAACIELVEQGIARGVQIGFDVTPWLRGGGLFEQILPPWIRDEGMIAGIQRLSSDPAARKRLEEDIEQGGDWPGWLRPEWDQWLICMVGREENRSYMGRSIADVASEWQMSPVEAAVEFYLRDEGQLGIAALNKCDEDIDRLLQHPLGVPIADGFALAPTGVLANRDRPNSYGTFPRVLEHYVRQRGVLTWEQAVLKMTSIPARRLNLWDRGLLRPEMKADIVVFDPRTVVSKADYSCPQEYPLGIDWVVVNGQPTVAPNGHTGAQAGRVL